MDYLPKLNQIMTAFETLYAHLKAMNYKDAPLFADGDLLFLNVGENYHILYLDDSLLVVDFVNSIIQHYRPYDKKLYIEENRSIDYLRTLDKIPDAFLHLMPAYLRYQELSGKSQSRPSILTIWPEATKFDFSPPVYSSECSTTIKYDIKELFLNTIGWVGKYSNKAKLDKDDFGTTHYHFDLKEFGAHYPLANIESDIQSFYYCDYNHHSFNRFSNVYKNEIKQLKNIEKDFISEWKKELSALNVSFNEMKLSSNNFLHQSKGLNITVWQTVSTNKLLMKIDIKNSFYSIFKKNYEQFNVDFCLCDGCFYYDGDRVVYILKGDYSPTLNEQNQFTEEELFTDNSLKLYVSHNRNLINHIAELLNINHNNEVHSFFTDLEKGVENDIAQLDKMFEIFEQYRQARHSQLVSTREILYKMHQDYLGDAPII